MLHFKPNNMSENDFFKLIEDKGVENSDLQIYTKIKEIISFRYKLFTNIDCVSLVLVGVFGCLGFINHSLSMFTYSLLFAIASAGIKYYINTLFEDYEEANTLIQDLVNQIAYEIWKSENRS